MTRQKIRKQMLCVFIVLMAISCNQTPKTENSSDSQGLIPQKGGLITFHLNEPPSSVKPLMLSQLADSVSYVALETRDEVLTDDGIQMGDRFYAFFRGEILCFDKKGKYLHRVGKPGRGPEEYMWLSAAFEYVKADPISNWVYVFSHDMRTQVYDEKGNYVKTLKGGTWGESMEFVYNHVAYQINGYYPTRTNEDITISTISDTRTGNELYHKKAKPINVFEEEYKNMGQVHSLGMSAYCLSDNAFYKWTVFQDTVYIAQNGEIRPYCLIIPENKYKPENQFVNNNDARIRQPLILKMYILSDQILLCVGYKTNSEQGTSYWVLCDMKNGSVKYYDKVIVNDLDSGPNIKYRINIFCLSAEDFKNDEDIYDSYFTKGVKAKLKDQEGKFQQVLKPLEDDANPIMRVIHWK